MVHDGVRLLRAADEDGDGIHWEMLKGVESTLQVENENRPEAEGGPVGEGTSTTRRTQVWITVSIHYLTACQPTHEYVDDERHRDRAIRVLEWIRASGIACYMDCLVSYFGRRH